MDFRQLRTFSCVAELGSLSKASDTLRVAQPALSRQIKLLEHELRAELFTRNGRGMVLTEAGRLLLAKTAGIVRQIDQIRDDIQSSGGPPSGRVVLGLVPTVSCVVSARLARRTVESYPGISLCIVESYSGHLIEWLHRGQMDLAVIYGPSVDLHLTVQALGRDRIVAVGPRGCGLAKKKQVEIGWLLRQKPPSSLRQEIADGRLETAAISNPAPFRELTIASPIEHPGSTAITLVTNLLRDEVRACRTEGLWDIQLT